MGVRAIGFRGGIIRVRANSWGNWDVDELRKAADEHGIIIRQYDASDSDDHATIFGDPDADKPQGTIIADAKKWPHTAFHPPDCFSAYPPDAITLAAFRAAQEIDNSPNGVLVPMNLHKTQASRNDPCPCGSGKKFKKCCRGK